MYDEKLKMAYEKSDEILKGISYPNDKRINTSDVLDYVRDHYQIDIDIFEDSFTEHNILSKYGAMMLVDLKEDRITPKRARIVLNSDNDASFRRFSLFHEIGHLLTITKDDIFDSENFVVSTHIDYTINNISKEQYEKSAYLLKEQIANIFALRVLMPGRQFYTKMKELNNIYEVADFFGLTDEAVISRMMIGA